MNDLLLHSPCDDHFTEFSIQLWEAAKKFLFFSGPATKRGGGVKAEQLRKKGIRLFLDWYCVQFTLFSAILPEKWTRKKNVWKKCGHKLEGGGGKALVAWPLKKLYFFWRLSYKRKKKENINLGTPGIILTEGGSVHKARCSSLPIGNIKYINIYEESLGKPEKKVFF